MATLMSSKGFGGWAPPWKKVHRAFRAQKKSVQVYTAPVYCVELSEKKQIRIKPLFICRQYGLLGDHAIKVAYRSLELGRIKADALAK